MYKEVNPAIFACVSFPFLFGVMFGDIAHGSLMLLAGIVLCLINDRYLKGSSLEAAGQIRYLILLMGIFATYMGFIYNEFFAIPLEIFGSCYDSKAYTLDGRFPYPFYRRVDYDCVYTVGMDPRWF